MKRWFCEKEGVESVVAMAAFNAGYAVAKNNPELVGRIVPVANGILAVIAAQGEGEAIKSMFSQAVAHLLEKIKDPLVLANIKFALSQVNFEPDLPNINLSVPQIESLVAGFINGVQAYK